MKKAIDGRGRKSRTRRLEPGLRLAVNALKEKTTAALARRLKITPQAVSQWKRIPINQLVAVERVTNIKRELLRPDIFRRR